MCVCVCVWLCLFRKIQAAVLSPEEVLLFLEFSSQLQRLLDEELAVCKAADAKEQALARSEGRTAQPPVLVSVANMQVRRALNNIPSPSCFSLCHSIISKNTLTLLY